MYLEHFGLTEVPFRITPHTEFFFDGAKRGATLEALIYAITHDEGIVKVSGEVGSGKTMLCRVLMERLPPNVVIVYLANPSLSRNDILFAIADDLGLKIPDTARTSAVVRTLHAKLIELHGEGRQVVVLIDEAHAMPMETLEEVRLLSNLETSHHKLLQLVMFGQPELDEVLARPDMRQLKERITQNFSLEPLRRDDIAEYLDFRMRTAGYRGPQLFSAGAIKLIASASLGLTRRINILAEKSLLATFAEGAHEITPREVTAAIRDTEYDQPRLALQRRGAMIVGAAAALVIVAVTLVAVLPARQPTPAPTPVAAASTETSPPPAKPTVESTKARGGVPPSLTLPASAPAPAPAPTPAVGPASVTALAAAIAELRPFAQERLRETQQWIAATDGRRWFIQLVATNTRQIEYAQNYLATADRLLSPEHARIYMADTGKEQRIGIIYGEFPSPAAASAAIERLPPELRAGNPFPRQVLWLK
jgi:type II secretory pathway predicted ATPase ExeA